MKELVRQVLKEHDLVPRGERALVAVSGGVDSVVLVHLLFQLGSELGFRVAAAHFDHGIRSESLADAVFVARLCACLGVPCVLGAGDVPAFAREAKLGLEEAGRKLRYRFLHAAAQQCGCTRIATAHHLNDQAETVMMRLARGTSVSGLGAMRICSPPFIRPLLQIERRQIEDYQRINHLEHVEDATNLDCRFTRNRVRHELLPLLEQIHPRAQKHLANLAAIVQLEEDYWDKETGAWLERVRWDGASARIAYHELAALHPALRRRVVRALLEAIRGDLQGLEGRHFQVLEAMFTSDVKPQLQFDLPGAWVARRYADLVIRPHAPLEPEGDEALILNSPGNYPLFDGSRLELVADSKPQGEGRLQIELDAGCLQWPLCVRLFQPGDRLKCIGMQGTKKLKAVFAERKLEIEQRRLVPLLCNGNGDILWVLGVRRSCLARCADKTTSVVRITWLYGAET